VGVKELSDAPDLVSLMIELQDYGVSFAAINARVQEQVVEHAALVRLIDATYPLGDALAAVFGVGGVELLGHRGVAGTAVALPSVT